MNWEMIGVIAEMLSTIAVIASLLYRARQVAFSSRRTRSVPILLS